jgi:hypothetical protein
MLINPVFDSGIASSCAFEVAMTDFRFLLDVCAKWVDVHRSQNLRSKGTAWLNLDCLLPCIMCP